MTREEKTQIIEELVGKFQTFNYFYITDSTGMTVEQINKFRRMCFERQVEYKVYKNTLIKKALESLDVDFTEFNDKVLRGTSGVMFYAENGKVPAKLLKDFYGPGPTAKKLPALKGASVDSAHFIGADQLDTLVTLKTKAELVGEIVGLLQSPAKNVISALQGGGNKLAGILKTLSERES
jgi:large subunit ribosomal protein L10